MLRAQSCCSLFQTFWKWPCPRFLHCAVPLAHIPESETCCLPLLAVETWASILALLCLHVLIYKMGIINKMCIIWLLGELNNKTHVKCSEECLDHNKHSIDANCYQLTYNFMDLPRYFSLPPQTPFSTFLSEDSLGLFLRIYLANLISAWYLITACQTL